MRQNASKGKLKCFRVSSRLRDIIGGRYDIARIGENVSGEGDCAYLAFIPVRLSGDKK